MESKSIKRKSGNSKQIVTDRIRVGKYILINERDQTHSSSCSRNLHINEYAPFVSFSISSL